MLKATATQTSLKLMEELKVDVHGQIPLVTDFFDRLVGVPERGCNGWYFEIQGRYNEEHAKNVINSLDTDPSVGLKSAARSMFVSSVFFFHIFQLLMSMK